MRMRMVLEKDAMVKHTPDSIKETPRVLLVLHGRQLCSEDDTAW